MNWNLVISVGSVLVFIGIQLLTYAFNQGKMSSRHEENQRRFHRIEQALGISDRESLFLTKAEADLLLENALRRQQEIDRRLAEYDKKFDELEKRVGSLENKT